MSENKTSILLSDVSVEGDLVEKDKIILDAKISGDVKAEEVITHSRSNIIGNIKSKRDKIKYELKPEAMTNLFKCRRCGSRETSYYEVQTRSADEPMTQFITCLQCNNRWKQ